MSRVISVCGYGPGIAQSVATKFGKAGFKVALLARNKERLAAAVKELETLGVIAAAFPTDCGSPTELTASLSDVKAKLGPTTVLFYNAVYPYGNFKDLLSYNADELDQAYRISVTGLITGMQATVPDMEGQSDPAVLVTGGGLSTDQGAAYAHTWGAQLLAVVKAAQHSVVVSTHPVLKPKGIHVAELSVMGQVDPASAVHSPDKIAEQFWQLYTNKDAAVVNY